MLSDKGVDPTSLFRRSEGEVMAMQRKFHSPQFIGFTNKDKDKAIALQTRCGPEGG